MLSDADVVIVGAGIAGCSAAESLRHEGFTGSIAMVGDEPHPPYTRPPLSKQGLSAHGADAHTEILSPPSLAALGIEWHGDTAAVGVDPAKRSVATKRGNVRYNTLVIATGSRARQLDTRVDPDGTALTLRTRDDADRIRGALAPARAAIVLGAGVLGSEIAAAARSLDCAVTLVGRSGSLTLGTTGALLSDHLERAHTAAGVVLRLAERLERVERTSHGAVVVVGSGERLEADVVIAAIGSAANTEWLRSSGLMQHAELRCDETGQVRAGVYAIGDVAAWRDPMTNEYRRDEHQLSAIQQAQTVAHHIVTGEPSPSELPYFWSELYGSRFQAYGVFPPTCVLSVVHGDINTNSFVVLATERDEVMGVVASNMTREFRKERREVDHARPLISAFTPARQGELP